MVQTSPRALRSKSRLTATTIAKVEMQRKAKPISENQNIKRALSFPLDKMRVKTVVNPEIQKRPSSSASLNKSQTKSHAKVDANDMRNLIEFNQASNRKLIDDLRAEMTEKFQLIESQIREMEATHLPTHALSNPNSNSVVQYDKMAENKTNAKIDRLATSMFLAGYQFNLKIEALHRNNKNLEGTLAEIIQVIGSSNGNSSQQDNNEQNDAENIDSISNAIQCMQQQVNQIEIMTMKNAEKNEKMHKQMHLLSAMFVRFNERIYGQLMNFNNETGNKLKLHDVIEPETLNFFENNIKQGTQQTVKESAKAKETSGINAKEMKERPDGKNNIPKTKYGKNRFAVPFNTYAHTRRIKIILRDTEMKHFHGFKEEFKRRFEAIIGNKIVNDIVIKKYEMDQGIIRQIALIVLFNVPLNIGYINSFKFPVNWSFYTYQAGDVVAPRNSTHSTNANTSRHTNAHTRPASNTSYTRKTNGTQDTQYQSDHEGMGSSERAERI